MEQPGRASDEPAPRAGAEPKLGPGGAAMGVTLHAPEPRAGRIRPASAHAPSLSERPEGHDSAQEECDEGGSAEQDGTDHETRRCITRTAREQLHKITSPRRSTREEDAEEESEHRLVQGGNWVRDTDWLPLRQHVSNEREKCHCRTAIDGGQRLERRLARFKHRLILLKGGRVLEW